MENTDLFQYVALSIGPVIILGIGMMLLSLTRKNKKKYDANNNKK